MRFKGTLVLLLLCAGFGGFLYFYEIKGGEKREKGKTGGEAALEVREQ